MFSDSHPFSRLIRVVVSMGILTASIFAGQPALAQPAAQPQRVSQDVLNRLGIQRPAASDLTGLSLQIAQSIQANGLPASITAPQQPNVGGLPNNFSGLTAQSAAVMTLLNGAATSNFREAMLMADADGREDLVADHAAKVADLSTSTIPGEWMLTRAAMSAHTFATGYTSTVYYYGDSVGNVYVGVDTTGAGKVLTTTALNLPTILNAFGTLLSDDQIVITGLAVNPVADLTSFPNVNGSFAFFNGKIGEMLYVTFWDTGSGLRLHSTGQVIQSGVLAFPIADEISPVAAPPGVQSQAGFPVTVGGAFAVVFSVFANVAGITVDDDASVYFQQVDLVGLTGGNIVKITSVDQPGTSGFQDRSLATSGFVPTITTLTPANGNYGTSSGPTKQINRATNYSGTSPTFGNIAALAAGPNNVLYAAVARSFVATDPIETRNTEGLFSNPAALGATPSMIISFADTTGAFDLCTSPLTGTLGTLPVANGIADVAQAGLTLQAGVNNYRVFALGAGPDVRGMLVGATVSNTLQLDFQIDHTLYSGLAVDEESKVFAISGGTPAGVGRDPSPSRGEILVFPDQQLFDRRADFVDLRGNVLPVPPASITNVGDGQSDRFDHLYYQAPLDQVSLTPIGLSGLARGFLLYLNRTRDAAFIPSLPNGQTQGDDQASGPIYFDEFDRSRQIAGGDDQSFPFRGDDDDGGGSPITSTVLTGGFEFTYREYVTSTGTLLSTAWNAFYLNSNGSLTFGAGDANNVPVAADFLSGSPRVAGAWADLNPNSHQFFTNTFPVQALGFANNNHFIVRWINVPTFGYEHCNSSNTFSISLYDDGAGIDENASQPLNPANPIGNNAVPFDLQEGPTDRLYFTDTVSNQLLNANPRPNGSGNLCFTYGRMDLLGSATAGDEVLVGVTPGHQPITTTPGINLSTAALAGDVPFPAALGISMAGLIPASPYELYTLGVPASYTVTGGLTTTFAAQPVFDLRQEGNDPALSTPVNQPDLNRGQVCFHNLDSQSITFSPLPDRIIGQMPINVVATATSGLTVTFSAGGQCFASGPTGSSIAALGLGLCTVTARQPGNTTFAAAPDVPRTFRILAGAFLPIIVK